MDAEQLTEMKRQTRAYDYVRFTWCDLYGMPRGQTVIGKHLDKYLRNGIGTYAGAIGLGPRSEVPMLKALNDINHGNILVLPEPGTFHPIPWAGNDKFKVGEVLCETHWLQDLSYQGACPRTVARQQLDKLDKLGYYILSGFEMEFKMLDQKTGKPLFDGCDVFNNIIVGQNEEFLFTAQQNLLEVGVDVEKIQTEYSPGQFEFCLQPTPGIQSADSFFMFKYGMKEMAARQGLEANFMTISDNNGCGNASHFNHSVWKKTGKNAFYEEGKEDNLSDIALYWIGGLLKHANALTALCSPSVNCYRRLHQIWIPDSISWGIEDRIASFRVKNTSPGSTYIENRMASGVCNPYIVLAANIAAGMDGIVNRIKCPPKGQHDAPKIPYRLEEALAALEADQVMVTSLGQEFVDWYCETKKQIDLKKCEKSDMKVYDEEALKIERDLYGKYM